jgi:outer membrane protein assembly factor BamB
MDKRGDVSPELVVDDSAFPPKTKPNPNSAKVWHFGGLAPGNMDGRRYHFGRTMSSCAIADNLLYISELQGYVHCLNATTGERYWTHNTHSEIWCSPLWVDDKIIQGNDGGNVLVFAHGKSKKLLATIDMERPVRAVPVAANGRLFVATENKLYAIGLKK